MSGYNGRRGQNVSQYIAGLNVTPSPYDAQQNMEEFNGLFPEDDIFLNNDFVDFEKIDPKLSPPDMSQPVNVSRSQSNAGFNSTGNAQSDILNGGYNLPSTFDYANSGSALPNGHNDQFSLSQLPSPTAHSPMSAGSGNQSGTKRKIEALNEPRAPVSLEEATRFAAEEDKRRRNTAASARFRVKKKQREQALEKTAKEMTDKVNALEKKIEDLEKQNTWLKGLLVEKNGSKDLDSMYNRHQDQTSDDSRSKEERKDGVGTESNGDNGEAA